LQEGRENANIDAGFGIHLENLRLMSKAIPVRAGEWQPSARQRVALLVPCFNEEVTIAKVVADFRAALPEATIYVYDNNSADRTSEVARAAGALVRRSGIRARATSCGECSPTSMRTSMFWSMAMPPTMRRASAP
jgi:cellulose synthase/poly-beta-1,6-N-acetylglucosamine synthase-like glycosyltransferase